MDGAVLRNHRIKKGYTQEEYAKKLGVSTRTLKYWESGDIAIQPMKLMYIKARMKNIAPRSKG
jgi:transcriptional regulator with XRE-family HTH domain